MEINTCNAGPADCFQFLLTSFAGAQSWQLAPQFKQEVAAYYTLMNRGKIAFIDSKIDSAIFYIHKAFNVRKPFYSDIDFLAQCYHAKGDYKNAIKYYLMAVDNGDIPLEERDLPVMADAKDSVKEYALFSNWVPLKQNHLQNVDMDFYALVTKLFSVDQFARSQFEDFLPADMKKSDTDIVYRYIRYCDSMNLEELTSYLKEYGPIHINAISTLSYHPFKLLVHHLVQYDEPDNNKLLELIKQQIFDGVLPNDFLKVAIDYRYMRETGFQYFGSYARENKEGRYQFGTPIDSVQVVDGRRAAWYLLPLDKAVRLDYGDFILPEQYHP